MRRATEMKLGTGIWLAVKDGDIEFMQHLRIARRVRSDPKCVVKETLKNVETMA